MISGLAHHQPERMVLTRFTGKNVGYTHLLQFWLLPGARTTVLNHFLFGHPRDRTLPVVPGTAGPSIGARLVLFMKRVAVVAKLAAVQLCVSIVGPARRTRPVSADQAEHRP